MESHSYEPSPRDITKISQADIFLYTGEAMEVWAHALISRIEGDVFAVDVSEGVVLEETDDDHEEDHDDGHGDDHGNIDPHIWTDPHNAIIMVRNIEKALAALDPDNAAQYNQNADAYVEKLMALDDDFSSMIEASRLKTICFGGRFAMRYFAKRYGLDYIAAFDSCSDETEPSAKAVAAIIDAIRESEISAIFHEELAEPTVAKAIANETGAKPLLLHSCHNVTQQELDAGATYLSLMYQNLENLRDGLR